MDAGSARDAGWRRAPSWGLTWAATGHRPDRLGGYGDDVLSRLVAVASRFLIESRPSRFIVGMALGWDTAVAIACVRNGIPFVAAVPFEGQERSWPRDSQERYRFLLAHAERVHVVCTIAPEYMDRTWWVADAMTARNAWMVDNCDAVAALWDGSDRGGTANCVRYARSAGKPVTNLWAKFVG